MSASSSAAPTRPSLKTEPRAGYRTPTRRTISPVLQPREGPALLVGGAGFDGGIARARPDVGGHGVRHGVALGGVLGRGPERIRGPAPPPQRRRDRATGQRGRGPARPHRRCAGGSHRAGRESRRRIRSGNVWSTLASSGSGNIRANPGLSRAPVRQSRVRAKRGPQIPRRRPSTDSRPARPSRGGRRDARRAQRAHHQWRCERGGRSAVGRAGGRPRAIRQSAGPGDGADGLRATRGRIPTA